MSPSRHFRATTLPRVAAVAATVLVAGLSAPPAAAQTAAQMPAQDPVSSTAPSAEARRAVRTLERAERVRSERVAEQQRIERAERDARERAAAEAAADKVRLEQFLFAVAVNDAEERAAAERAAAERAAAQRAASRRSSGTSSGLAAVARCESGGNYGAVSSSGRYRGAYQFARSTWDSVAARSFPHLVGVDPAAAAPADQDAMAQALYSSSGSSPWPHCGRHL